MRLTRIALALAAASVTWMAISAQTPSPATQKPAVGTGVIAGRVVEADSTRPVPEAIVELQAGEAGRRRVMTDDQGRFAFVNLPAGQYHLVADQYGYLRSAYGRSRPEGAPAPIQLADSQRFTDATIPMWRMASITGRVVDEFGEPVARVSVRGLRRTATAGRIDLEPSGVISTATDDRGIYRLSRLAPGDYAVMVSAKLSTFPVDILRDALTSRVNLGVGEVARLGDSRYLQIGDQVIATMSAGSGTLPPAPDSSGRFRVFQTTYYPTATVVEEAEVMRIAAGDERTGVDIRLVAVPAVSISGRIAGPDGPVSLTPFRLVRAGGSAAYETYDNETATGITTADGSFKLLGVPRGRYLLRVGATSIQSAESSTRATGAKAPLAAVSDPIVVGDADVTGVSVTAYPLPTLRGRIEMSDPVAPVPPESIELILEAFDSGSMRVANPRVDKSYAFTTLLLPGRYIFSGFAGTSRCASVLVNGKEVGDALVPIGYEDVELVFKCGGNMSRVTGRIRDSNGNADQGAQAVVFPADRRHWTTDVRPLRFAFGRPNTSGVFTISNLPAGEYFVAAVPDAIGRTWQDPRVLETLARTAARITLSPGDLRSIDLTSVPVK